MALGNEEILDAIAEMPVKDLVELVNSICDRFDVSATAAAAPVAVATDGGGAAADEAPSTVDVILTGSGDKKVAVIKVVRSLTSLGLKEAKDLVDGVPKTLFEAVEPEKAADVVKQIEEAGGTAETK